MACDRRATSVQLYTSNARNGMKFYPYTWLPFIGLYTEDGRVLRGIESQGRTGPVTIPAPVVAVPSVCCGQLGI